MIAENNATLPILSHVDEITNSVTCNQVTIIVGDTGSGKSTQTPQILRAAGYGKIVMALPRRLITKTLARRLAAEMQVELGTVVGYKLGNTGNGIHDRLYNMDTDVLLMTNALLVDHIQSSQESEVVYIIGELHVWDLDVEVAVGLIKRKLAEFPELRLVLMSATIEAERLSKFFDDAPIINVDGQMYPVEDREPSGDCHQCIMSLFNEGRDILVFLDGEREINACIEQLESLKINAELIPLHAKLDPEQQDRALRIYDRQKIVVATNVAESSLTVPGITGVVDGGKKKIKVVLNGVDCLMSVIISKAEAEQRRGRAGRCGPGVYINLARGYQDEYPMPEIQRLRLDKSILQLLVREVEIEDLELFHQPPFGQISEAKRVLKLLGCINQESKVTEDGRQVAELPLGVHTGRMVVEAIKCGVLADVMTIAAILENESFLHRENDAWRRLIGNERDSELLAMLTVFKQLKDVRQHEEFEKLGIVTSSLIRVKECRSRLFQHLKNEHRIDSSGDREAILKCIAVGMLDRLFVKAPRNLIAADCSTRLPNRSGIVFANTGDVILGVPRDIIYKDKKYGDDRTLPIVTFMTKVSFDVIMSLVDDVTQLGFSKSRDEEPIYDPEKDAVVTTSEVYFHDIPIKSMIGEKCTGEIANRIFKNALAEILSGISTVPQNLQEVVRTINERNRRCRTIKTENPKFRYREWDYSFF